MKRIEKYSSLALTLILITAKTVLASSDQNVPLIAIIMQPSSGTLNNSYFEASENFNFVPASYISYFSQTGSMPLLVPHDLSLETLERIIRDSDALFLPGGGTDLFDKSGKTTFYQDRVTWMLKLVEKINNEGKFFPVMGTCLGFQQILVAYDNNDPAIYKCDLNDNAQHPVIKGPDYSQSKIFSLFDQTRVDSVFAKGSFYYEHNCRITVPDFNSKLSDKFLLTGTAKTDKGEEFVTLVEHRKYPIFAQQFHPEKSQFERDEPVGFLDRDLLSLRFMRDYVFKFVDMVKETSRSIDNVPDFIKSYFYLYHEEERFSGLYFESAYVTQSYRGVNLNDK